jgi:hypothetical protein
MSGNCGELIIDPQELARIRAACERRAAELAVPGSALLSEILGNSGITDTLSIDGREIPIESVTIAIRESFMNHRAKELIGEIDGSSK